LDKKSIYEKIDAINNNPSLTQDEKLSYMNDVLQDCTTTRTKRYCIGRIRRHFNGTPERFLNDQQLLEIFDQPNDYAELKKRDDQRKSPPRKPKI